MQWRPKVAWDSPRRTIDFDLPQRPWTPMPTSVGGRRISAAGVKATYRVRHDELVEKRIRFSEEEWPMVRDWLLWAQGPGTFQWHDDQTDDTTMEVVYLYSPAMGEAIRPERSSEFPLVYELTITLRLASAVTSATIGASTRSYFEPPGTLYLHYLADIDFYVFRTGGLTGLAQGGLHTIVQSGEFYVVQEDSSGLAFEEVGNFVVVKET